MTLSVPTTLYDGQETTRVIGWQGLFVQEAYQAAKEQMRAEVPEGVYVSCCLFGSPAQVSVKVGVWITEIDKMPVPTLDAFLQAVTKGKTTASPPPPASTTSSSSSSLNTNATTDHQQSNKKTAHWLLSEPTPSETEMTKTDPSTHVRVKYITHNNVSHVSMLRLDHHYWPTWQIQKDDTSSLGWKHESFSVC